MSNTPLSRRAFLRAGAAAGAAITVVPALADDKKTAPDKDKVSELVPKRKLGKTGVEVSMLNQGALFQVSARHLNIMHTEGIRCIDTAVSYGDGASEKAIGQWFQRTGHRTEYFLVTKDTPKTPRQWVEMLDERLEALQTDYIDLYFIHGLGGGKYGGEACRDWPKDKEWAAAADKIRKSGKARFVGFSTHCRPIDLRTALLNNAAKGGWVDAIMPATNPTLTRENKDFSQAVDNCHKAGVGLISMKECKGGLKGIKNVFPGFKEKGLSPYTAVLSAVWTDGRFASICSHMDNVRKLKENAAAARNFKPLTAEELAAVDRMLHGIDRTYCVACDGSCQRAAGTQADLNAIARYVSYAQDSGQLKEARKLFAALPPEARNWISADLKAASRACKCNLDFPRILAEANELLA